MFNDRSIIHCVIPVDEVKTHASKVKTQGAGLTITHYPQIWQ